MSLPFTKTAARLGFTLSRCNCTEVNPETGERYRFHLAQDNVITKHFATLPGVANYLETVSILRRESNEG